MAVAPAVPASGRKGRAGEMTGARAPCGRQCLDCPEGRYQRDSAGGTPCPGPCVAGIRQERRTEASASRCISPCSAIWTASLLARRDSGPLGRATHYVTVIRLLMSGMAYYEIGRFLASCE